MNYEIIFLNPAAKELEDAYTWYENIKVGLGDEFIDELEKYLNLISDNPYLFEEKIDKLNLHSVPLDRFPFSIIYWVEKEQMKIFVDAIFHSKKKPKF